MRALERTSASTSTAARHDSEEASAARADSADREGSAGGDGASSSKAVERYDSPSAAATGSSSSTSKTQSTSSYARHMTESEKRYEEVRKKRLAEKVRKEAKKSHKDRVQEFNTYLERLSEHHDLPRVSSYECGVLLVLYVLTDARYLHRLDLVNRLEVYTEFRSSKGRVNYRIQIQYRLQCVYYVLVVHTKTAYNAYFLFCKSSRLFITQIC